MTVFNNLNSTAATLDAGFTYAEHAAEIDSVFASLASAADTIALTDPVIGPIIDADSLQAVWSDGTELNAGVTSVGTDSISLNGLELEAADGARLDVTGTGKISFNSSGEITDSNVSLQQILFGNDQATELLNGSVKFDLDSGAVSGKLNSLTLGWFADNPATPALEWQYVSLKGKVGVSGDFSATGFGALSGKVTSVEWGTLTAAADGTPLSFAPSGTVSGVKIDAAGVIDSLESGGFDALMAGVFAGNDRIDGTAADDFLEASTGNDKVFGEEGDDHIDGGAGNDQLFGGAGDDHIIGGAGNDKIVDDSGNNTVIDTEGNAKVTTGGGDDDITTGAGNDRIVAGDGANDIESDGGNDKVIAGSGDDFILAGDGNDKVTAGEGNNWVEGGSGNDVLRAGAGNDVLVGGAGGDKLNGGGGDDVFVFDNLAAGGKDLVKDFNVADDFLAFDTDVFTALAGGITADNLVIGKAALDTNDFLVFDTQGGKLYYDADGSGGQSAVQIAIVKGSVTGLASSSFMDADSLLV